MKYYNIPDIFNAIDLLKDLSRAQTPKRPKKINRPLVLYGAGDLGRMAKAYFDRIGIKVQFVVDRSADKLQDDEYWRNTPLRLPNEINAVIKRTHLLAVCVVTIPYEPLANDLIDDGWEHIHPFYDIAESYVESHPLSNGWYADPIEKTSFKKISNVLHLWSDNTSRAHHIQFIAWRLLRQDWVFDEAPVNNENRFFIPEIIDALSQNEYFFDAGAHHGSVSQRFIDLTKGNFKKILMIEPDSINLRELYNKLNSLDKDSQSKIQVMATVVGQKKETRRFFEGLGYASQLSELGGTKVEVTSIDEMKINPTFIKFHLEGCELSALKGAKDTILKCRPIIVTTSYHNDEGIWKLPMWLMSIIPDYRFYFRLHSWCGTGGVVYGLP